MIDTETLTRLQARDAHAFATVVRTYQHEMLCTAFRIIGRQADAEEIRQRVLLRIWESPHKLPSAESFEAWLRRCVVNASITWLRKEKRERQRNADIAATLVSSAASRTHDDVEQLKASLAKLPPEQRAMLSLKFDQQLTVREIGRVFEQSHTTVQSKLNRAIEKLRSLMQTAERRS